MIKKAIRILHGQKGASLAEYAALVVFILLISILVLPKFGKTIANKFNNANDAIENSSPVD